MLVSQALKNVDNWSEVKTFGRRAESARYVVRPGAYAIVRGSSDLVAVVRTPNGVFLPGGGIEPTETARDAIRREVLEECGLLVRLGVWEVRAIEIVYSSAELTHFEKRSTFIDASEEGVQEQSERDHTLTWLRAEAAIRELSHQSHSWALDRWREHLAIR